MLGGWRWEWGVWEGLCCTYRDNNSDKYAFVIMSIYDVWNGRN